MNFIITVLQRLGYLLELLNTKQLALAVEKELAHSNIQFIYLRPDFQIKEGKSNNRFKVIINDVVEIEE